MTPAGKATALAREDIPKAAASIAHMVDEWTQRGWNDAGRAQFAAVVERRLGRFLKPALGAAPGSAPKADEGWRPPTREQLAAIMLFHKLIMPSAIMKAADDIVALFPPAPPTARAEEVDHA